uniref:Uncharacterized protein n=1 Tax=Megaselia scalaris TaxID=36166 RepID=T1GAB5_MEGSC
MKKNGKVIYLEIEQGKVLPMGNINLKTVTWKKNSDNFSKHFSVNHNTKVHINRYESKEVNYVLTKVRFANVNNELYMEFGLTKLNYTSGILERNTKMFFSKTNAGVISTSDLDIPTASNGKHTIIENGYLRFTASSRSIDAAQSTVPYLDTGDVAISGWTLLNGVGLNYKQSKGFGGFIGLSVNLYNHNNNINDIIAKY